MGQPGTHQPRVVIVEDFALIQENIRRVVQPQCEVLALADNGQEAITAVETHSPDILLLDVSLPDMSGFAVAERIADTNKEVKIIFLTAHSERAYVDRAFSIGAQGYVLKGMIWSELPNAIRAVSAGEQYRPPLLT